MRWTLRHGPPPGAPTLDGPLGDVEQGGRLGHRVAVHVDGDDRGALLGRQPKQGLAHQQGDVQLGSWVGHRCEVLLIQGNRWANRIAPQTIPAGVDDDAM